MSEDIEEELFYVEHHLHNNERWFGLAASPSGETHRADPMADSAPFQIDAGNDAYGAWVQIFGSDDTPIAENSLKFDPHRIEVVATERAYPYVIQLGFGTVSAGTLTGTYTEIPFNPVGNNGEQASVDVMAYPKDVGTKVWARCKCRGQNTATLDFYIGIHEYPASDVLPIFDNELTFIDTDGTEQITTVAGMVSAMFGVLRRQMKIGGS